MRMKNNLLKNIGTISIQEIQNISAYVPWENLVKKDIPFSAIGTPSGYLFTQGSACGSLATTSNLGWKYNADLYLYRKDGTAVDRDRYLGSITQENNLVIFLVPKSLTPYHHIDSSNLNLINLPPSQLNSIIDILQKLPDK